MKRKTPLEMACNDILGEDISQFYNVLSNLLLLNPDFIRENDKRLSAKVTSILFDDEIDDKPHVICEYLDNSEFNVNFTPTEIDYAKILLEMDPELATTGEIVSSLKNQDDQSYSEIMRKVPIKKELRLYRTAVRDGFVRRRI
ncbi:MAG: hypothetical protein FK733_15055 [Asgard group archaeon]|nr:hypothetical protein [Asgard group archaeon]